MFELKEYQKRTIEILRDYLTNARYSNPTDAFAEVFKKQGISTAYRTYGLGDIPYICLRLPTGGGKTVLASYAIKEAASCYLEKDYPLVLWLVPTNMIRTQTLTALKTPKHPYRQAIDEYFQGKVSVFDIADVEQIRPQDLVQKVCIVVGTLATLRVEDTTGRRIYSHNENFEPHFARIHTETPALEKIEEGQDKGKIKCSFANICHINKPLVIMDEAHNARTSLTFDTLKRVDPSCVIELTATPNTTSENGSNVLVSVSASELKAEEMIKLPIMLSEHPNWQEAVAATIETRKQLEKLSKNEDDFVRPIALLQAESKDREVTVEVLKDHLIQKENINPEAIAIATGDQKELGGVDLFDPNCKVEYIITIEALKEGWDCSFAYIFCSVAHVRSSKDVEQLLGRVLRMPYAKKRKIKELNYAYANVSSPFFSAAAQQLRDNLINMGFEELEAAAYVRPQAPDFFEEQDFTKKRREEAPPLEIELEKKIDIDKLSEETRKTIEIAEIDGKTNVKVSGIITDQIEQEVLSVVSKKDEKSVRKALKQQRQLQKVYLSPAQKGEVLQVPQLSVCIQGELELADKDIFLDFEGWNLLNFSTELTENEFSLKKTADTFEVDVKGKKVIYHAVGEKELQVLTLVPIDREEGDLVRWLDREIRQPDILQSVLLEFIRRIVKNLMAVRSYSLDSLIKSKYILSKALMEKIGEYRKEAIKKGFQSVMFGGKSEVEIVLSHNFSFDPEYYPVRQIYNGSYHFQKHYYPIIGDLKDSGEEYDCAIAIERLPETKYWVRNLAREPYASFWLPTSEDRFYPDFVVKLEDERILVIEYKGEHLQDTKDTKEKKNIGEFWEVASNGSCLFLLAVKRDEEGRDVHKQLLDKVKGATRS